jgi:hypothetical protein
MCGYCGTEEEKKKEAEHDQLMAAKLRNMADKLDAMASGRIDPHGMESRYIGNIAKTIIRGLVEDFL